MKFITFKIDHSRLTQRDLFYMKRHNIKLFSSVYTFQSKTPKLKELLEIGLLN